MIDILLSVFVLLVVVVMIGSAGYLVYCYVKSRDTVCVDTTSTGGKEMGLEQDFKVVGEDVILVPPESLWDTPNDPYLDDLFNLELKETPPESPQTPPLESPEDNESRVLKFFVSEYHKLSDKLIDILSVEQPNAELVKTLTLYLNKLRGSIVDLTATVVIPPPEEPK